MSEKPLTLYSSKTNIDLKHFQESESFISKDSRNEIPYENFGFCTQTDHSFDWENIASSKFSNLSNQEVDEVKVDFKFSRELDVLYDEDSVSSLEITPVWLDKELRPAKSSDSNTNSEKFRLHVDKSTCELNEYTQQSAGDSYFAREMLSVSSEVSSNKRQKVSEVDMQR